MTVIRAFFAQFLDVIVVLHYVYRVVGGYCCDLLASEGFTERYLNVFVYRFVNVVINKFFGVV